MIAIDNETKSIFITRGDATQENYNKIGFTFPIYNFETELEENYKFQTTDKISFVIFEKKGYTKDELLRKEFTLAEIGFTEETEVAEIPLTSSDTKVFPLTDKAQTFWYDIILNDEITILGFDGDGGKRFVVYPEAEEEITP
jgi:hypothetical protein